MKISSVSNGRIKEYLKLKQKKYRDMHRQYLVEGEHLVEEALKAGVVDVIITSLENFKSDKEVLYVTKEILEKLSFVESPQNIMALCHMLENQELNVDANRYLILDDLQDPGNLGTLIRSAVAFDFDQVIMSPSSVDIYNDKFIRSTQGACFYMSIIKKDLVETVEDLSKHEVCVMGTSLENGQDIHEFNTPSKYAIILGNEGNGVSKEVLSLCHHRLYIPIQTAESLNVAVAGGICMFHFSK